MQSNHEYTWYGTMPLPPPQTSSQTAALSPPLSLPPSSHPPQTSISNCSTISPSLTHSLLSPSPDFHLKLQHYLPLSPSLPPLSHPPQTSIPNCSTPSLPPSLLSPSPDFHPKLQHYLPLSHSLPPLTLPRLPSQTAALSPPLSLPPSSHPPQTSTPNCWD